LATVLVVDDEPGVCRAFRRLLERAGHEALIASTAEEGLRVLEAENPDLVFLDVRLPGMSGLGALREIRRAGRDTSVVVMTAHGDVETAVEAMRLGAWDYLPKPLDVPQLERIIASALDARTVSSEVAALREEAVARVGLSALAGRSPAMQKVYKLIGAVATRDAGVLILGETGTGKEMVARAIHRASPRAEGAFEPVSCSSIPEALLESELYGHEKGAFTGAVRRRVGRLERADGGTLLLDEVGEIPLTIQPKLLRFLEEKEVEPLGGGERRHVDVRVLAATHRDLPEMVAEGTFREDLFYRLNVISIRLPALRERLDDIPLLTARFLAEHGAETPEISTDALDVLTGYAWPGNVRELRNAVEHAIVLARGDVILPEHLPRTVSGLRAENGDTAPYVDSIIRAFVDHHPEDGCGIHGPFEEMWERPFLEEVMRRVDGNQVRAARWLGIHRSTLRTRLARYREGLEGSST
jgi:DNA-binding NtrC family response regulator